MYHPPVRRDVDIVGTDGHTRVRTAAKLSKDVQVMDGPTASLFVIPIVGVISLVAWLVVVFHAGRPPLWKAQRTTVTGEIGSTIFGMNLPRPTPLADAVPAEPAHRKVVIPLSPRRERQSAAAPCRPPPPVTRQNILLHNTIRVGAAGPPQSFAPLCQTRACPSRASPG